MAWRCCCLPATSWRGTELATVGASLEACRPRRLLSSSERTAVRLRPAREAAIVPRCMERLAPPIAVTPKSLGRNLRERRVAILQAELDRP